MAITYATTGLIQTDSTITGNTTTAAATAGATSLTFSGLTGVVTGMVISAPAAAAGCIVNPYNATTGVATLDKPITADIASGTTITFQDADGILFIGSGTTSAASGTGTVSSLTLTSGHTVAVGQVISQPAVLAGAVIASSSTTLIGFTPTTVATAIPSGTTVATAGAGTGATITDTGIGALRQRAVLLTGTGGAISNGQSGVAQFIINGTYNIDASRNVYYNNTANSGTLGTLSVGNTGTLNISGTDTRYVTGTATGQARGVGITAQSTATETFSGALSMPRGGTINMNGVQWYGNAAWSAGALGQGSTAGTWNISNSSIRLGTNAAGTALNTLYNASSGGQAYTFNFNNVQFNGYAKLVAVSGTSTFNNVTWYKDTVIQPAFNAGDIGILLGVYSSGTTTPNTATTGLTLVGPRFGITGNPTSYFNTHLATGNYSGRIEGPVAVRNAVYGYEQGVTPLIGKAFDFGLVCRPWIELRKNIQLNLLTPAGTVITSGAGSYFEDTQQNTGALQIANVMTTGAGYNNGTFTSSGIVQAGSSGTGTVTVTIVGGQVTNAVVTTPGSGYNTTANGPIALTVNSSTFSASIGAPTTASTLNLFASRRYAAEALSGCPTLTDNRTYTADVNASGVLTTTTTNSGNGVTYSGSGNPIPPSASTALTGVDVLTGIANASITYPAIATVNDFRRGLFPIDQRFSADGSPNWSVSIPVRGYLYQDGSTTVTAAGQTANEALAQTITRSLALPVDTYISNTGITEATATGYTDVTLVTPAPTRGPLAAGDTQGALVKSNAGTLTTTPQSRTLDQLYAKAKRDYTQRTLNTTAGTVARTGFGIDNFLSASGTLGNATMNLGGTGIWNATLFNAQKGTTFTGISMNGDCILSSQPSVANAFSVNARNITLGSSGTPAQWTTTNTVNLGTVGSGTFTIANIPTSLVASGSVTTGSVTLTGNSATDGTNIGGAMRTALEDFGVNANIVTSGSATITITFSANNSTSWYGTANSNPWTATLTFTAGQAAWLGITGTTVTVNNTTTGYANNLSGPGMAAAMVNAINAAKTNNAVTVSSSGSSPTGTLTITSTTQGYTGVNGVSFSTSTTSGNPTTTVTGETSNITNSLIYNFTAPIPAVAVTWPITPTTSNTPVVSSSISGYITGTSVASNFVMGVAGFSGSTVTQQLTPTTELFGLPQTGVAIDAGGSVLSGGSGSTYTINQTGNLVFRNGQDTILSKNINTSVGSTLTVSNMELYRGVLNITTVGSNNYSVQLSGNTIGSGNLVINQLGGTGTVIVTVSGNTGGTITAGTGNVSIQQAVIVNFDSTANGGTVGIYNGTTLLASTTLNIAGGTTQLISFSGTATNATFTKAATQIVDVAIPASNSITLTGLASTPSAVPTTPLTGWSFNFDSGTGTGTLVVGSDATTGFTTAANAVNQMGLLNFNKFIRSGVNAGSTTGQLFANTDNQTITLSTTRLRIASDNSSTARQIYGVAGDGTTITNVENQLVDRLVVGGTTSTFPQVRIYPNSSATLGDVRQAVIEVDNQILIPALTVVNNNVKKASLLVPADDNLPS